MDVDEDGLPRNSEEGMITEEEDGELVDFNEDGTAAAADSALKAAYLNNCLLVSVSGHSSSPLSSKYSKRSCLPSSSQACISSCSSLSLVLAVRRYRQPTMSICKK